MSDPTAMRQRWHDLLFLHWTVSPGVIQPLLPPGLKVDTFDGHAYLGLVLFRMTGVAPAWFAPVQGVSDLLECNVRTYVRLADGSLPGVWFFSLDAAGAVAVAVARATFALPYFFAHMEQREHRVQNNAGQWTRRVEYTTRRHRLVAPTAECHAVYETSGGLVMPAGEGTVEHFLVERYRLYAQRNGRLSTCLVRHSPYLIEPARLISLSESLVTAAGIERPDIPPLVHYSRQVVVEVAPPQAVKPISSHLT